MAGFNDNKVNLIKDNEGKYCWIYEMPMMKSFFLLLEVWKVILLSGLILFVFFMLFNLLSGNGFSNIGGTLMAICIPVAIIFVLSIPAYYIVAKANNGMYTVYFEMDDAGVDHIQIKTDKARALEILTFFVGGAAKNRTTTAAGMLSATGGSLYSRFAKVKKIGVNKANNLITLSGPLMSNHVYVDDDNFDFVKDYIVRHCPDATVK